MVNQWHLIPSSLFKYHSHQWNTHTHTNIYIENSLNSIHVCVCVRLCLFICFHCFSVSWYFLLVYNYANFHSFGFTLWRLFNPYNCIQLSHLVPFHSIATHRVTTYVVGRIEWFDDSNRQQQKPIQNSFLFVFLTFEFNYHIIIRVSYIDVS